MKSKIEELDERFRTMFLYPESKNLSNERVMVKSMAETLLNRDIISILKILY